MEDPPGPRDEPRALRAMLHWIGLALVAGAFFMAGRWMILRHLGSTVRFPWRSVVFLIVVGSLAAAPWVLRIRLEGRLTEAARALAGKPVSIQCQSFAAAFVDPTADLGHVSFTREGGVEPKALIKRDGCRDLAGYLASDKESPTREQVIAVHVLTHETMHMTGITSESEAECLALGSDARMASLLGASPTAARDLARTYRTDVYPDMPSEYRAPDCEAAAGA